MAYDAPRGDYQAGRPKATCDRCGFTYRHDELRKEWTGLMVCAADFDSRPAELTPPRLWPEGLPVRDARPDPDAVTLSEVNTTSRDDL